jgi:hypothetical protein
MIGGIDIVLEAPLGIPVFDMILRRIRHFWPEAVYQNADDEVNSYPIREHWESISCIQADEFFIYKNLEAAQSWDKAGAIQANHNTMIHVIIGKPSIHMPELQQITVVYDVPTPEIKNLLSDLKETFHNSIPAFA